MTCKNCGSDNTIKYGTKTGKKGKFQRHLCNDCGRTWKGELLEPFQSDVYNKNKSET